MPPQSERWWVKIGDFGISKRVKSKDTALRTQTGTPYFQAPEIQGFVDDNNESSEYSDAVDIWSLGCVVYYISTRQVPFLRPTDTRRFCQGILPFPEEPLVPRMSETGIRFIKRLLIPEPVSRLSAENALKDPWVISALTDRRKLKPTASSTGSIEATEIAGPARYNSSSQDYNSHSTITPGKVPCILIIIHLLHKIPPYFIHLHKGFQLRIHHQYRLSILNLSLTTVGALKSRPQLTSLLTL
jgi:serine/threonine protein kinase